MRCACRLPQHSHEITAQLGSECFGNLSAQPRHNDSSINLLPLSSSHQSLRCLNSRASIFKRFEVHPIRLQHNHYGSTLGYRRSDRGFVNNVHIRQPSRAGILLSTLSVDCVHRSAYKWKLLENAMERRTRWLTSSMRSSLL
jgi:hypothetical protein